MKKQNILILFFCFFFYLSVQSQTVKILFDASQAETAGNADWVIDADAHNLGFGTGPAVLNGGNESNAQKTPTPAQSGISGSTSETYWNGALSYWGIDCVRQNYIVESLPYNGQITYGNSSNTQDLSNYKVFIVCEPNIIFTATEKTAILNFVQNGGGLFMISDHDVSDRNNDGKDSPFIWNDLMTNNTVQTNPFGMTFDFVNFSQTSNNIPSLPTDSILHGIAGNVTSVQWSNGTSITLNPTQNSTVKGVVYKTGSSFGNSNVMCAYARYGNGKVAAIGDSSPCDDGSGDPNDNLYDGYIADANGNHRKLLMNITIWLATSNSSAPPVADFTGDPLSICSGQSSTFTNNSSAGITTYAWNFGSGSSPSTANTVGPHSVTYSTSGQKTVSLTVTNAAGSNTKTRSSYIVVNSNCSTQDVGVVSLLNPDTATCPVADNQLEVQIKNFGPTTINFFSSPVDVVMNISNPSFAVRSFTKTINNGALAAGATIDITLDSTYDLISPGDYIFNAHTVFASDANSSNDSMSAVTVNVSPGFESDFTVLSESMGSVSSTTTVSVHETNSGFDNNSLTMTGSGDVRATQTSLAAYAGATGGANIYLAPIVGRYFTVAGINTTLFNNLQLSFGFYKNTAATLISDFKVQVSIDGINYSDLSMPSLPAGAAWNFITVSGSIPSAPSLSIRFLQNGIANQYRVDDILLIEKIILPTIATSYPSTFCQGDSAILTAGSAASYLWSNEMTTQSITVYTSGTYSVTETNASGCGATSDPVVITVNPSALATVSISANTSTNICSGTSVIFTANPSNGGSAPVYQWKVNGTNVGTNNSTYSTTSLSHGQNVSCVMTSNAACVTGSPATSNSITMTVNAAVAASLIVSQTSGTNPQCMGASATFTAVPSNGGSTPVYQWKVNGTNVGTNNSTYSTNSLSHGQNVSCVMTSNAACVAGNPATSNSIAMSVNAVYTFTRNRFIAQGHTYSLPGGQIVSTSGTYNSMLHTMAGCDSNITTILAVVIVEDNNLCTTDACDSLTGAVSHTPVNTDDGNPCTIDGCDPITGVYHTLITEICGNGIDDNCNGQIDEGCFVTLHLKVFIEGFYLGGSMMKAVANPVSYPAMCDTITVELRNAVNPYGIIQFVKNTIDINGNGDFVFPGNIQGQSFYIVIRHRNALETWSANPVFFNMSAVNYNFSDAVSKAYGNNLKVVGFGIYGLISGDVNQSGSVNLADINEIESSCILFSTGYVNDDLTGDGLVESADCSLVENNFGKNLLKP